MISWFCSVGIILSIIYTAVVYFCTLFYTPEYIYSCSYALYGMHYFMHGCDIIT